VNGYIFFPFPGIGWKTGEQTFAESMQYGYTLEIITPNGIRTISFVPH